MRLRMKYNVARLKPASSIALIAVAAAVALSSWAQQTTGVVSSSGPAVAPIAQPAETGVTTAPANTDSRPVEGASVTPVSAAAQSTVPQAAASQKTPAEISADESAKNIVVPEGVPLQSSEGGSEETTAVLAPGPGTHIPVDQASTGSVESAVSEKQAIGTAADMLKKLGLVRPAVRKAPGTREMDDTTPTQPLIDAEVMARLIGEKPTAPYQVVYEGTPIPDPMVIPWIRKVIVLKEMFDDAVQLLADGKIREGKETLLSIETEFPNTEYAIQAREILKRLQDLENEPVPKVKSSPTATPIDIHVDPNVKISTVLIEPESPEENRVMINGRMYKPGDQVRGFTNHRVVSIADDSVTIEVEISGQKKQFNIPVRQSGKK